MREWSRLLNWRRWALILGGGIVLQAATSCEEIAANAIAGIGSSIANSFIRQTISQLLNSNTGGFGF